MKIVTREEGDMGREESIFSPSRARVYFACSNNAIIYTVYEAPRDEAA